MSQESLASAKTLAAEGRLRNSVSRAYYAAYAAVTGELTARGMSFAHGWNNPAHEQVPDLVGNNLPLPQATRWRLRKAMRILRRAREDADYRPGVSVDRSLATDCLRFAILVMEALGVPQ
jgi:uncharacterized protein (UPF0332 family)